jgi:hypothetical protein|tara:strand:- start:195 stop:311 length:117 start_codon:yes stop_codon:yes gene_type:complete
MGLVKIIIECQPLMQKATNASGLAKKLNAEAKDLLFII